MIGRAVLAAGAVDAAACAPPAEPRPPADESGAWCDGSCRLSQRDGRASLDCPVNDDVRVYTR